jgi:hypothetical protein
MNDTQVLSELLQRDFDALVESLLVVPERSPLALPPQQRLPHRPTALFAELEDVLVACRELRTMMLQKYANRYVNPGWTLRELLAHLASWAREFRHEVETVFRGNAFDYAIPFALSVVGPNRWNEEQVRARGERSFEEILDELVNETERLQVLVLEIPEGSLYRMTTFPHAPSGDPEARWEGSSAQVILGKCQHDRYHLAQIRAQVEAWRKLEESGEA